MNNATQKRDKVAKILIIATGLALVFVVIFVPLLMGLGGKFDAKDASASQSSTATPSASPTPSAATDPALCASTWVIQESDNKSNRWFFEGIAAIKDASTNEEATAAAFEWQQKVRLDPDLIVGATKVFLQKDVDRKTLVNSEGCATQALVDLDLELGILLASSKITPEDAPATGYNTAVNSDIVVGETSPGIGGDRAGIKITLADGREVWIMARCGNLVTPGAPPLPPGKSDNPPPTTVTPVCQWNSNLPPDSPDCLEPKKPAKGSAAQGNAETGKGGSVVPGPGTYVPPAEMAQPPAAPYVPPAAPAPVPPAPVPATPSNPTPAPVPTPDPAPAPPPEVAAPVPSEAPSTCPIPPGATSC